MHAVKRTLGVSIFILLRVDVRLRLCLSRLVVRPKDRVSGVGSVIPNSAVPFGRRAAENQPVGNFNWWCISGGSSLETAPANTENLSANAWKMKTNKSRAPSRFLLSESI
jgi:hypothetical protein